MAPCNFTIGTTWRLVASYKRRPLYPRQGSNRFWLSGQIRKLHSSDVVFRCPCACVVPFLLVFLISFSLSFPSLFVLCCVRPLSFSRIFIFLPSISSSFFLSLNILHYFLSSLPFFHSSLHLVSPFFPNFSPWLYSSAHSRTCTIQHPNNTSTDFPDGFSFNSYGFA